MDIDKSGKEFCRKEEQGKEDDRKECVAKRGDSERDKIQSKP